MIDYTAAGRYALVVKALAMIESNETETATGDSGLAQGILQQHPVFVAQWYKPSSVRDSWVTAYILACTAYLSYTIPRIGITGTIQAYNLGRAAYNSGQRNPEYLEKWITAFNHIGGKLSDFTVQPIRVYRILNKVEVLCHRSCSNFSLKRVSS